MDSLTSYACGIDLVEFNIDIALGKVLDYSRYIINKRHKHIIVTFFSGPPGPLNEGKVKEINHHIKKDENLLDYGLFSQEYKSAYIYPLTNGVSRFMYCITSGTDFLSAYEKARNFYINTDILDPLNKSLKKINFDYSSYYLEEKK